MNNIFAVQVLHERKAVINPISWGEKQSIQNLLRVFLVVVVIFTILDNLFYRACTAISSTNRELPLFSYLTLNIFFHQLIFDVCLTITYGPIFLHLPPLGNKIVLKKLMNNLSRRLYHKNLPVIMYLMVFLTI